MRLHTSGRYFSIDQLVFGMMRLDAYIISLESVRFPIPRCYVLLAPVIDRLMISVSLLEELWTWMYHEHCHLTASAGG